MLCGPTRPESATNPQFHGMGVETLVDLPPIISLFRLGMLYGLMMLQSVLPSPTLLKWADRLATVTSNFAEAFATFGYTLSFGATKTAAIVRVRGDGSRAARSHLYKRTAALPILLENSPPESLPLVVEYKHLGMIHTASLSLDA